MSADRAALLVLGRYGAFESLLLGLVAASGGAESVVGDGSMVELLQSHPSVVGRLRRATEFLGSTDFVQGRAKVLASVASSRLMTACRYCGFVSPKAERFCPSCGVNRA